MGPACPTDQSTSMHWNTILCGAASTLLLLSGCANTGTSASVSPNEIHIGRAELSVQGAGLETLEVLSGDWQVQSRWWPTAKAKRARTSDGTASFSWTADQTRMVGSMEVGIGQTPLSTAMVLGVDSTTDGFVLGWDRMDGSEVLPMCLAVEGSPDERMIVERKSGKDGMIREVMGQVSEKVFRYQRFRTDSKGNAYKDLEIVGKR